MSVMTYPDLPRISEGAKALAIRRALTELDGVLSGVAGIVLTVHIFATTFLLPRRVRRLVREVVQSFPNLSDDAQLQRARDLLLLARGALLRTAPLSLRKATHRELVEEIDEHLDSIDFVLNNRFRLDAVAHQLEKCA